MRLVETAGKVFLFGAAHVPRFFFDTCNAIPGDRLFGLPVYHDPGPWEYDALHSALHQHMGRRCREITNQKARRNDEDSPFSKLVRWGNGDRDRPGGCYDTPFIDIDKLRVEDDGTIMALVETKHPRERTDGFQLALLNWISENGGVVEWATTA